MIPSAQEGQTQALTSPPQGAHARWVPGSGFSSIRTGSKRSDCAPLCHRSEVKPPSGRTGYGCVSVFCQRRGESSRIQSMKTIQCRPFFDKWINLINNPSKVKLEGGDAPGSSGPNLVELKKHFFCIFWKTGEDSDVFHTEAPNLHFTCKVKIDPLMRWGHFYLVLTAWKTWRMVKTRFQGSNLRVEGLVVTLQGQVNTLGLKFIQISKKKKEREKTPADVA